MSIYQELSVPSKVKYTFEDLRPMFGTGRSYVISGTGRDRKYGYRSGVMCKAGDIEESEWCAMAKDLIQRSGESELHEQLSTYEKEHGICHPSKAKRAHHVLDLHMRRIFDDELWIGYIPFNQKFRPDIMAATETVSVIPSCCNKPGLVTRKIWNERYSRNGEGYCPHCEKWVTLTPV